MTTAFVTLTDQSYFSKALRTLEDLRGRGQWTGDIVLMTVGFDADPSSVPPGVLLHRIEHIDHEPLFKIWDQHPLTPMADNRHRGKVYQWDKLQVFTEFFCRWDRVVFLDAGLRVLDSVEALLGLPWRWKCLAPDDADPYDNGNRLVCQFDWKANSEASAKLLRDFGVGVQLKRYFLNCIFLFDTALIKKLYPFEVMKAWMLEYPICCCNEMGIMNLFFTAHHGIWEPFPQRVQVAAGKEKYLFGWNENNYKERPTWESFVFMKYPYSAPNM